MSNKLFVGNLSYNVTENDLQDLFAQHGTVTDVNLMLDRMSGRSRGFAFVTMSTKEEAEAATNALNGHDLQGRNLTVNEARPRPQGGNGGGGGGGGRGYGGGGGGGGGGREGGGGRDRGGRGGGGRHRGEREY
jgi:RNA recognition motif-containing protein